MNILSITSLLLFAIITAYKTRWGIYIILILIPTYLIRTQIFSIPTTFLELSIYILAIIWLIKKPLLRSMLRNMLRNKKNESINYKQLTINHLKPIKPFLIPTILFITAFIISTTISPDKKLSLGILKAWLFDPLLFTIIFINQINPRINSGDNKHLTRVITSLSIMVAWVSIYGLYEYFINPKNLIEYSRLDSIFTSANYLTMLLVPITILIIGFVIKKIKQSAINNQQPAIDKFIIPFLILTASISIATIYLTRSYSGYLGTAAGIFLILLFLPTKRKTLKTDILIILLGLLVIFAYFQKDNPKFKALTNFKDRTAVHTRLQIWQTSKNIIKDNPITGIGLGNFHNAYTNYILISVPDPLEYNVIKPHNLYLNLWMETGLLGLLAFIWLIIIFYKKSNPKNHKSEIINQKSDARWTYDKCIYIPAMTALLIQGLFDTPYFKNDLSLIFWLLIGLAIINKKETITTL